MYRLSLAAAVVLTVVLLPLTRPAVAQDDVTALLQSGKLTAAAKQLQARLADNPFDDKSRFALGMIQFLQTFEHLGTDFHRYGLRTERISRRPPPIIRQFFPENPNPQKIAYKDVRRILSNAVKDLMTAEATLSKVKRADVKLSVAPAKIKIDLFGQGKPVDGSLLLRQFNVALPAEAADKFLINFDRGDVAWLRGYCHFLAAWGEMLLAIDGKEVFECTAHLFFEKVDTPHRFLLENRQPFEMLTFNNWEAIADLITGVHLSLRFELAEPKRMSNVLRHLEAMVRHGKQMWKYYDAETDDDREWIPNLKQSSAIGVRISKDMRSAWEATLEEADLLLKGKKLLPFWRGKSGKRGVNLRRIFTEPRTIDVIRWVQGSAATPYLEDGQITKFADERFLQRLNRTFGGPNFFGFAFWFN